MVVGVVVVLGMVVVGVVVTALSSGRARAPLRPSDDRLGTCGPAQADGPEAPEGSAMRGSRFVALTAVSDLDQALARSATEPIWLYQHDPYCPVSRAAWKEAARFGGEVFVVDVSRQHDLTKAIELRTGVRHESPQVLLLRHGRAIWHASHFAITAATMAQAASRTDEA